MRVRVRVMVWVRGAGVTSKEIDRTWMCDSMETRDAAPRVRVRVRVRVRARGGGYFLRLHTPFSIVGVMSQPHSLG